MLSKVLGLLNRNSQAAVEPTQTAAVVDVPKAHQATDKHQRPVRVPRTPGRKPKSTPCPGYSHRKPGMAAMKGITADGDY